VGKDVILGVAEFAYLLQVSMVPNVETKTKDEDGKRVSLYHHEILFDYELKDVNRKLIRREKVYVKVSEGLTVKDTFVTAHAAMTAVVNDQVAADKDKFAGYTD